MVSLMGVVRVQGPGRKATGKQGLQGYQYLCVRQGAAGPAATGRRRQPAGTSFSAVDQRGNRVAAPPALVPLPVRQDQGRCPPHPWSGPFSRERGSHLAPHALRCKRRCRLGKT